MTDSDSGHNGQADGARPNGGARGPYEAHRPRELPDDFEPGIIRQLDQRTQVARQLQARLYGLADDLGGWDHLSFQKKVLVERIIWMEHHLRRLDSKAVQGEDVLAQLTQMQNSLVGLLRTVGLEREVRTVNSLEDVIARHGDRQ